MFGIEICSAYLGVVTRGQTRDKLITKKDKYNFIMLCYLKE
jgi:hypothetical protein